MRSRLRAIHLIIAFPILLVAAGSVSAAATIDVEVDGNTLKADISFPVGIQADLTITFPNAIGLSADSIGLGAEIVDLTSPTLLSRLPDTLTSIPAAFPVMITIEPPSDEGLSFTDAVAVELHTHHLTLVTNTPLRLFKAPLDGEFHDITETIGAGSIRSRGRTGGFSQFLIVADLRTHETVASRKLDGLEALVADAQVPTALASTLQAHLTAAEADIDIGEYLDAIDHVDDFIADVEANAGSQLPNVWRASRDLDNLAGEMVGQAASLLFTLRMANSLL